MRVVQNTRTVNRINKSSVTEVVAFTSSDGIVALSADNDQRKECQDNKNLAESHDDTVRDSVKKSMFNFKTINVRQMFDISSSTSTCRICKNELDSVNRRDIEDHFYTRHKWEFIFHKIITKKNFINFYRTGDINTPWTCKICNKIIKSDKYPFLRHHLIRKHLNDRKEFFDEKDISTMDLRLMFHTDGNGNSTCKMCLAIFRGGEKENTLRRHLRMKHMKASASDPLAIEEFIPNTNIASGDNKKKTDMDDIVNIANANNCLMGKRPTATMPNDYIMEVDDDQNATDVAVDAGKICIATIL